MTYDNKIAATALSALGHEMRLHIFRLLVRSGERALTVGEIGAHVGAPPSTLAHHLSALVQAGLVEQERHGRMIVNKARFDSMNQLIGYLSEQCCAGVDELPDKDTSNDNAA